MDRIERWDTHLVEFAIEKNGLKFQWGRTDCVVLTRQALKVLYGLDPWKGSVPTWKGKKSALVVAQKFTHKKIRDMFEYTGAEEVQPPFATSGHFALAPTRDEHGLPGLSILLPGRKVLISTPQTDVMIIDKLALPDGTRFYTYG